MEDNQNFLSSSHNHQVLLFFFLMIQIINLAKKLLENASTVDFATPHAQHMNCWEMSWMDQEEEYI